MTWELVFSQALATATHEPYFPPIAPVSLLSLSGSQLLVLSTCDLAPPSWWLGCRLRLLAALPNNPVPTSPAAVIFAQNIQLATLTAIRVPQFASHYNALIEIPEWFGSLTLQVWQSTTPVLSEHRYRSTFSSSDLDQGLLTVVHNLGLQPVPIALWDSTGDRVYPDDSESIDENTVLVDLSSFGTLEGVYIIEIGLSHEQDRKSRRQWFSQDCGCLVWRDHHTKR